MSVGIISTLTSNEASVIFALRRLGVEPKLVKEPQEMSAVDRLILPGVGSAGRAMQTLRDQGLDQAISLNTKPLLGICLGMQILFEFSEEDQVECLGLFKGRVEAIDRKPGLRVPHMGWNELRSMDHDCPLLNGIWEGERVFFVHSFAVGVHATSRAVCDYGTRFSAVVGAGQTWGCQFHPERSGGVGSRILKNFLEVPCL